MRAGAATAAPGDLAAAAARRSLRQTVADGGGVFPVAGAVHLGGNDESRFGAGRKGHTHEGQDIIAAEGTPVVAPLAGTVAFVDYQAGGAGHYVVLNADDGRAMFFAHLQDRLDHASPPASASPPAPRSAASAATGSLDRPAPALRDLGRRLARPRRPPVDPLPQLQAWAASLTRRYPVRRSAR